MQSAKKVKRRYITGFDGLRTIGVIGVILYHLRPELFKGGYLGVPIFMVISGYLITEGLINEIDQTGKIDLKTFFTKRVKRLYPGLIAVLFATSAYIVLFSRDLLHNLHMMVVTNLTYVYNWWQIMNGQSYFARFANNESPFTHLWTLSIEGQYYLIWPLIVLFLMRVVKDRGRMFNLTFLMALASGVWMFVLYRLTAAAPGADPSRLYYGTDTRAFAILLGAALAFIWPSARLTSQIPAREKGILNLSGLVALAGMLWMVFRTDSQSTFLYQGGMFLFSVLVMVLVAVVAHPASIFGRLLSNPVFKYVGSRSYGLYLYQFPVMIFFENAVKTVADHPVLYPVIEVAIIVVLSELSYRFIEQPVARFDYRQTGAFFKGLVNFKQPMLTARVVSLLSLVVLATGSVGIAMAPSAKSQADNSPLAKQLEQNKEDDKQKAKQLAEAKRANEASRKAAKNSSLSQSLSLSQSAAEESKAKTHPVNQQYEKYGLTQVQLQRAQTMPLTAVGDSVMLDGKPGLQELFPKAFIDASVSRQLVNTIDTVKGYAQNGSLADTVVIGLGTNGPFTADQMAQMMQAIGANRKVYWVNVRVPTRSWQGQVNDLLKQELPKYKNLTVIDWFSFSNGHNDWFYDDMVHPNPTGNPYYASFIAKQLLTN